MKETQTGSGVQAVFEDGAREGVEPPTAAAAAPLRNADSDRAVPPGAESAAPRAFLVRSIGCCGLGERADADLVAAVPLVDVFSEHQEVVGGQARHERPKGVRASHVDLPHPSERTRRDCRQTKNQVGARANSLFGWEEHSIRGPCGPRINT